MNLNRATCVAAMLIGISTTLAAEELVRFDVEEAAGVEGRRLVTGGVPLNRDALPAADVQRLRLLDERGQEIDFTPTILARWSWPEGSVQWLLLDFNADFEAGQTLRFALARGEGRAASGEGQELRINETPEAIEVDTGMISFSVSRERFAFLGGVTREGVEVTGDAGGDLTVHMLQAVPTETDEENWLREAPQGPTARLSAQASDDYHAEVEFLNDRRAVIKLSGTLAPAPDSEAQTEARFPYIVRLTVRAGDSRVHVRPTLLYDGDVDRETLRRIRLELPLAGEGAPLMAVAGGQGEDPLTIEPEAPPRPQYPASTDDVRVDLAAGERLSLLSVGPKKRYHDTPIFEMARIGYTIDRQRADGQFEPLGSGDSSRGWVAAGDDERSVYVAVRDFWRLHPKELSADAADRAIWIWLWPDRGNVVLDGRRHSERKVYEEYRPGEGWRYENPDHDIGYFYGRALSNELVIDFQPAAVDPQHGTRIAAELNEPLYLLCEPEYYRDSDVIGPIAPFDPERFPRIEGVQEVFLEWMMRNQRNYGWYGQIDYGDVLMEHDWFSQRNWGESRHGWLARGYSGWLNNDGQVDHTLYLHALRRGDRELFRFTEAMTRHVGDIDTPHLEMPFTGEIALGINDNMGRPRVGGGSRHNSQHWGDYVKARGSATQGLVILYGMTGDPRLRDIMQNVATFHMHHDSYENHDGLGGLARFYHFLGDERLLERAREVRPEYAQLSRSFVFFNNRVLSLWRYWQTTGDESVLEQFIRNADEINAVNAAGERYSMYAQGFVETLAYHMTGDERHIAHITYPFAWMGAPRWDAPPDRRAFEQVDLSGAMQGGARSLPHSELWQRARAFQPMTPEKAYHFHGVILQKFPFVLTVLEDESFLE